ncbi:MAG: tyrosine decarboxylase MfnA [Candidatus Heimdallarchaeota archaeon]|nr:tyrosine decarboxylase MfnA [Candidatus Heimdallarchaeota archaeon]
MESIKDIEKILQEISKTIEDDASYEQIMSSMCTPPPKIAREIAGLFAEKNLGDPGLFPQTIRLEKEVLETLASFLHAPKGWIGTTTSGGSESNLLGCWAARNWSQKKKEIEKGKIIFPMSAHVSFEKAADILGLQIVWAPLNDNYQVNIEKLNELINPDTVGLVGIAGTTGTGACDNIQALNDLAEDHELYLHVDAAHGGMILPFLDKLGLESPIFDFRNSNVSSITIDTHKIFGNIIPGGSIIFRSKEFTNTIKKKVEYLADSNTEQLTITGTRPATPVIAAWVLLKKFGEDYILSRVKYSLDMTSYIVQRLQEIPEIIVSFEPPLNIIGFTTNVMTNQELVEQLQQKGWQLSLYAHWIRIVVMPHMTKKAINHFILDLRTILKEGA